MTITTENPPETTKEQADITKDKKSEKLRKESLRATGVSFFVADACLITSGIMAKVPGVWTAGAFGLTAGAVGALYGKNNPEKQLEHLHKKLGNYLHEQKVEIPQNPDTAALAKEGGLLSHINTFLHAHPSQVMNVFYGLIGSQFIRAATEHKKDAPFLKISDHQGSLFTSGCFLIAGALGGLLIKEKKSDPEHPPGNPISKAVSWVQEKPLRFTGTLFNINQVFLAKSALNDRKMHPDNKSYVFKLLAVAAFTLGNTLFAISSKAEGGGKELDDDARNALAKTSAHVIAAQPKEVQAKLLGNVANHLASQPNMGKNADELTVLLHAKVNELAGPAPEIPAQADWKDRVSHQNVPALGK